jgi:putative flippase GtrA
MSPITDAPDLWFERRLPTRFARFATDLVKYGFSSAAALAWDVCLMLFFNKIMGVHYLIASAIGFCGGLLLIYLLSVGYVFEGRRRFRATGEFLGFLATGVAGLLLNILLMRFFVGVLCLPLVLSKIPTAGFVFAFNFLSRRAMFHAVAEPMRAATK